MREFGQTIYAYREGLLSMSTCPDCKWKLARLIKIGVFGVESKETMAVACANPKCWRYTDISQLTTWKRW